MVAGLKRGIGVDLAVKTDAYGPNEEEDSFRGAILVSDDVWSLSPDGGWAEAAGEFTAKAAVKAKGAADKVAQKTKPKIKSAASAAGDAVNRGAFAADKQVAAGKGRLTSMFSSFKEEYNKALQDD